MAERLDVGGNPNSGADGEKDAVAKSSSYFKALGATRLRDLSAIGLLAVGSVFYYGSAELQNYVEKCIRTSPYLFGDRDGIISGENGIRAQIKQLQWQHERQKEINTDIEFRVSTQGNALKAGGKIK